MSVTIITRHGRKYALVPMADYRRSRREMPPPEYPLLDADGTRNAMESIRVSIARRLIEDRRAAGLTQQQLANLSNVRQETISRIESAQRTLTARTLSKLTKALRQAKSRRLRRPQ